MINMTVLATVLLVGLTLLIGMSILIYKHYRFRRKSMDWGDIERYDTPLVLLPPGSSNNSSFRSYKYSQLVSKQDSSSRKLLHPQRQCQSVGNIERHRQGSRSSTKSCPPGVFTVPSQMRIHAMETNLQEDPSKRIRVEHKFGDCGSETRVFVFMHRWPAGSTCRFIGFLCFLRKLIQC